MGIYGTLYALATPRTIGGVEYSHAIRFDDQGAQIRQQAEVWGGNIVEIDRDGAEVTVVFERATVAGVDDLGDPLDTIVGGNAVLHRADQRVLGGGVRGVGAGGRLAPGDVVRIPVAGAPEGTETMAFPVISVEAFAEEPSSLPAGRLEHVDHQLNWSEHGAAASANRAHWADRAVLSDPLQMFPDPDGTPIGGLGYRSLLLPLDEEAWTLRHAVRGGASSGWEDVPASAQLVLHGLDLILLSSSWAASNLSGDTCFGVFGDILFDSRGTPARLLNEAEGVLQGLHRLWFADSISGGAPDQAFVGDGTAILRPRGVTATELSTNQWSLRAAGAAMSGMQPRIAASSPYEDHWEFAGGPATLIRGWWGTEDNEPVLEVDEASNRRFHRWKLGGPIQAAASSPSSRFYIGAFWRAFRHNAPPQMDWRIWSPVVAGAATGPRLARLQAAGSILSAKGRVKFDGLRRQTTRTRGEHQYSLNSDRTSGTFLQDSRSQPADFVDFYVGGVLRLRYERIDGVVEDDGTVGTATGIDTWPAETTGVEMRLALWEQLLDSDPGDAWNAGAQEYDEGSGGGSSKRRILATTEPFVADAGQWTEVDLTPLVAALMEWRAGARAVAFITAWPVDAQIGEPTDGLEVMDGMRQLAPLGEAFAADWSDALAAPPSDPTGQVRYYGTMAWDFTADMLSWTSATLESEVHVRATFGEVGESYPIPFLDPEFTP